MFLTVKINLSLFTKTFITNKRIIIQVNNAVINGAKFAYPNGSKSKYEYRVYSDVEIVKVSGKYDDSENRIELKNVTFEVTYIIKDNTIIAFLFNEIAINDAETEYTEITKYCIPYEGEVNTLPKEVVDELLKAQS